MDDKLRTDKLIKLIQRLRKEMRYAQDQPIFIDFIVIDCDLEFEPGTTESLLPDAAKDVGLEISQAGKESAHVQETSSQGKNATTYSWSKMKGSHTRAARYSERNL